MIHRSWLPAFSFLALVFAQLLIGYVDPAPVLRAVNEAMGVDKLRCITFSGAGYSGRVGQNTLQSTDWPLGKPLSDYSRTINFEAKTCLHDAMSRIRQAWAE